jgi:predicted CoA-binding protein
LRRNDRIQKHYKIIIISEVHVDIWRKGIKAYKYFHDIAKSIAIIDVFDGGAEILWESLRVWCTEEK